MASPRREFKRVLRRCGVTVPGTFVRFNRDFAVVGLRGVLLFAMGVMLVTSFNGDFNIARDELSRSIRSNFVVDTLTMVVLWSGAN
jgi:hypothetical protein